MVGRSVIVTGGFGVLGSAVAGAFAKAGDRVARVDQAPASAGGRHALDIGGVDLTDVGASAEVVAKVVGTLGGIDVLVNVAGGFAWQTHEEGDLAAWRHMFATNLLSAATITRAALAPLKASPAGRIVSVGAGAAVRADAGMGAYAASKSGVHRMTEALAVELTGTGVTANAVLPSIIDTPRNRADMPDADFSTWVQPEAIADVVLFVASPAARSISGALIPVSRGTPD